MVSKLINVMAILGMGRDAFSGCTSIHYNVKEGLKYFKLISRFLVAPMRRILDLLILSM